MINNIINQLDKQITDKIHYTTLWTFLKYFLYKYNITEITDQDIKQINKQLMEVIQ